MNTIKKTCLGMLLLGAAGVVQAGGNVNGTVGIRSLDKDTWGPIEHQPTFGVLADFQIASLPLYAAVGAQISVGNDDDEPTEITAAIADFSAGLKVMPTTGVFRPYIGAGVVSVGVSVDREGGGLDDDDSDRSFGYYLSGGALFRVGSHFNLGFDLRWIGGTKGELFGIEADADSFVASALIGYGWGN